MMARTGDEPSFNILMDQYHAARNSLEDELSLAENALMISTTKQDIQIISKNLQQLGDRYVQLWKDLSVTNEFHDLWSADHLQTSHDVIEQKYFAIISDMQNSASSVSCDISSLHELTTDPCVTPVACCPILDWPIPSTENDRCVLPLIPSEIPPDLCAVAPAFSADPCPTPPPLPSSEKYVPPHRRITHSPRRDSNYARSEPECNLCTDELHHRLWNCHVFLEMRPYDRLIYVINEKLCHNCLLPNHETRLCGKKSICSVPDCGMKHSKFIHVSGMNSDLFMPRCFNQNASNVYASSSSFDHIVFDDKLDRLQFILNRMSVLLVSVVETLQKLKPFVGQSYHNSCPIFTFDDLLKLHFSSSDQEDPLLRSGA